VQCTFAQKKTYPPMQFRVDVCFCCWDIANYKEWKITKDNNYNKVQKWTVVITCAQAIFRKYCPHTSLANMHRNTDLYIVSEWNDFGHLHILKNKHLLTFDGAVWHIISGEGIIVTVVAIKVTYEVEVHLIGTGQHIARMSGTIKRVQKGAVVIPSIIYLWTSFYTVSFITLTVLYVQNWHTKQTRSRLAAPTVLLLYIFETLNYKLKQCEK